MQIEIPDFDDDDSTSAATPFGRSAPQQLGRGSPTPSNPFGDHGQSATFPFPAQDGGSLPGSSLLSAAPISTSGSGGGSSSGGMFAVSNGSGIFAPPGHTRGESDTSLQSFRYDPPPRAKRKGSFASLKAAFKGANAKSVLPVPKNTTGSHSQSRRPSASAASSRIGMRSMHSAAPSYAASEFSDGGAGNSSFTGFGGFNGFNITTGNGFGTADEDIPPVPQLPSSQAQSSAPRDLSSSGGFKFGGMRPRNISTSGTSQVGGSTADFSRNVPIPRPPRRATTPYEDTDTAPDPKTPAEYALHAVFIRFVTEVEQKMSAFLKEPLVKPLLSTLLGPGADRQFDSTLDSLAHIALKHTRLVIDALARWRRTQRLTPTSAQIPLNPGGSTQTGSSYGSYVYSQSEVTKALAERMELMTVYVLSRALLVVLAVVSELGKDVLGEGMGSSLEENSFEPVRNPDLKRLALSGNHRANAELYASLLGQIANIRFQSVTDRYLRELDSVAAGQVPRDHDARYEHIVEGLKHIQIKVWPPEAFEEGAEFMEMLSKSFFNAHGTRLKIAFAKSLVDILHPIGKTAQAEVNHPGWAKAIDLIYPKAREMIAKPRYFAVAYPLVISALCVAPQDFFAKNWMSCIDLSVAKMKQEKQSRVMCLNGILRIIWTYLYRCHEPSSTATSKLDIVLKHLFPPKGQSIFPPDESLECHEYILHFILSRHFDYGVDLVMEFLQESEALGNGTLDLALPFRPIIALRAILLTLTTMQKDSKPAWPSSVDFTTYDTQDDYTFEATFLPESFYTKPGVTTFFERSGPVIGKLAMTCAQAVGHLTLSDERFLRTNYSFEEGEQLVFKRRGELSVAYPRHLDPQVYFLMVCFESWPRCLHPSISLIEALDLLIRSLNHVDAGLAEAASSALRRIAANEQHVKAAVWRCTRYLFSPPVQIGNRDTSALRMTSEQEYVVPLWADLVDAWAEQLEKPPNDETNDSDSVKVDPGELAQDVEGGALCLLSSVSQLLRSLAVKILLLSVKLIPNAQKRSPGSQTSPANSETRVCNILLGKGVSISTIFERRDHAPPEKYRRKFIQWQQNKDPNCLLRLAQSKDEEDLRVWTYVFPAITQECMVRCPYALEYARMAWNAWIVRFHPIMSTIAGISSKVAAATPFARPARQGSGASEEVEDRRDGHGLSVEQWRCWIIALCSCATQSDTRPTPAREHGRVPSDPASQRERLTTARGLFRLIIPFLSSDQTRFRDAVTTALGSVHLSTFKTVLEDLQSITRHIYDEFRSTAANRSAQTARRARSQDRLYVAVAQVHQLTAHFLRDPKSLSDQGALHFMLQFVRETKTFLSHNDIKQDCDSHRLRRLFCGVVENLFDALSNRKDIDRFMWPHARLELFHICQEWCVYGPASGPVRQRHAAMRANATRYGAVALYDSECEQLVEAVPAALASLCVRAFFYVDKTIRSPGKHVQHDGPSPLTVHDVLDWINASLEHPSESVNASGRKALKSLLTYPARNEELLDEICRRAFASLHTMPGSTPSFGVVADVILTCTDSPFTFSQVVCLALASLGDTDHQIRRHGFDVLEATHRQTSRVPFIAESEAAIRSYAPSVYLPGQRRISDFLATNHPGEAVPLLAQCALHLSHLREGEALVLHALEPWMAHVELMAESANDLLPTGDLCMHNLLALTIRFGDTHPSEIQALWTKLVAGTYPMNHHAIVKWLIEQATWLGNAAFVAYSRRVIAYLSRTQFGELVFHELCTLISPATMSIQKATMPKRPRSHMYTADLSTLLPLSESRKQLSVAQLALLFLGDVALDPTWDISYQLPIFLHAIFLQTDHKSASVEQEIHHLLLQTLRTCTAAYEDSGIGGLSREDVKSSIARLADQNNDAFWLSDEPGILDMEKLCFEVLRLLEPSRPRLRQEWGLLALEWGAHSSDASTASLSLQLLRILRPRVQQGALNELLARLTNTVASTDSGPQKVCQDVLMSLTALVKADVLDHTLWPQLFWCARACLSTTVEAEYAQALIMLKTLLQVLDITRDEVIEDLLDHQPESWDGDDISLQAVILPGLRSSTTWKDSMEVLKSLSRCTHDQFVDPSAGRLRSLYTICLPPFLEAMDQPQLDEDLAELAMNIARMADNEKRVGISRLMTSFAKQKFRTKEDFLRQAVSCLRENYTSKHSTEILTLLLGLVLNSERWLRVKSMQLLKLLFQHVETKNQNVLSELLMPLLSLLRTDLALQALDVLDEPLSVSGGLAATHVLRMSMHIRSSRELEGNLVVFGVPEPSGWCVPRPLEMAALCRRNVQALYESLSATASARPITMAFSVALDNIPTNEADHYGEFGTVAGGIDDDLGNLVSQLNDLNSFFTAEDDFPEPIVVSPVPPSAPITFQNEAERRVAAILSRSLAKSGTHGDSISSMEGIGHNSDRERGGDKGPGTPYIGLFEMSTPHRDGVDTSRGNGNGDLQDAGGNGLHTRGYLSDSDGEEAGYEADSYLSPSQSHNHSAPLDEIVGTSFPPSSFISASREETPVARFGGLPQDEHGPDSDVESDEDRKGAFGLESPRQKLNANRRSSGGLRSLFGVGGSNHNAKEGESRAMAAFGGTVNMSMNVTSARTNQKFDRRRRI
ncbi:cell polarity protein [Rhizoctonia solani 123E]|uniref:Cell polarity protein n=1 Tax=Rhizoctonia solani 123E TaxID=1423351 RepID=A0A074SCG6_9AGAM|nr:cell polarity protein [Rhizoctonia solani 123E]